MSAEALCEGGLFVYSQKMFYVYVLKSEVADEIYTGLTNNLDRRLSEHNSGHSSHTRKFIPWKLVNYIAFADKQSAEQFEAYLKSGSGRAFARKHFL
jgi:predicted GIY-YIG superfamily endonuclease